MSTKRKEGAFKSSLFLKIENCKLKIPLLVSLCSLLSTLCSHESPHHPKVASRVLRSEVSEERVNGAKDGAGKKSELEAAVADFFTEAERGPIEPR